MAAITYLKYVWEVLDPNTQNEVKVNQYRKLHASEWFISSKLISQDTNKRQNYKVYDFVTEKSAKYRACSKEGLLLCIV